MTSKTQKPRISKSLVEIQGEKNHLGPALQQMREWAKLPAHKWIPWESFLLTSHGYITPRQGGWLWEQLKKVGIEVDFTLADIPK